MATKYRINSSSFGLHLERLAVGLKIPLVNAINSAAKIKSQYSYYACCNITDEWPHKTILYIDIYDDIYDIDENLITEIFNKAYQELFLYNIFPTDIKLSISYGKSYIDYNQYCRDIIINDSYFTQFHSNAIKWHLGK